MTGIHPDERPAPAEYVPMLDGWFLAALMGLFVVVPAALVGGIVWWLR